ncbi:MAG: choice-of-anchor B family protein, partial [Pseudomonadota bacterium]
MFPKEQTRPIFYFLAGAFVWMTALTSPGSLLAHGDGFPFLYVAENGVDQGQCVNPTNPCQSIAYALGRAEKGDEVRVATGRYSFAVDHPADTLRLLGEVKRVRGGFNAETGFLNLAEEARATVLLGPHESFRSRLARNGFLLAPGDADENNSIILAQATPPAPNTRYVAINGNDVGDCLSPFNPCSTIAFALARAEPGEEVRVGEGGFDLSAETLARADAQGVRIRGGLLQATGFTAQSVGGGGGAALQSVVTGPSFSERGRLAEMGFRLQQDAGKSLSVNTVLPAAAAEVKGAADCIDGVADNHPCKGLNRISQMPLGAFSSLPGRANDIWGFVDQNDGREYVVIGLWNGTAVVDATDPSSPQEVGTIAGQGTIWRDIKVYQFRDEVDGQWKAYAYVTADDNSGASHGIQVIDLTNLPASISLAATLDIVDSSHNVYISNVDYQTGTALSSANQPYVYILGSNYPREDMRRSGEFFVLDVSDPITPTIVQTPPFGSSYSHDATTLLISDERARECKAEPCEVLIDYSEDAVDVWDVSLKGNAHKLGSVTYPDASYIHSGWWTENKNYVFIQDELDEVDTLPSGRV